MGWSLKMPLVAALTVPPPLARSPLQLAVAVRTWAIVFSFIVRVQVQASNLRTLSARR
jgi:hypothetical protein